ncbi:MAG TPA: amidohydrolase family protein [Acidimicrobiia bacterium]|nr:amidohydrolase family protein [Acidimicrobiia bacterium]
MFGDVTGPVAEFLLQHQEPTAVNSLAVPVTRDEAPLTPETADEAWGKGALAPGSWDMHRRLEVMDFFGVNRTLIFPTGPGNVGFVCVSAQSDRVIELLGFGEAGNAPAIDPEMIKLIGTQLLRAYNDWCIETAKISDRLRPVAFIDSNDIKAAIEEIDRVTSAGVRAICLPTGVAPGGKSPGHVETDPLWEVLTSKDVPLLFHGGGDFGFVRQPVWSDYGRSNAWGQSLEVPELILEAYAYAQMGMAPQNYITTMIYGGVFDRFPTLKVGAIESSAYWVGPTAENMKNVGDQFKRSKPELTPAEYFERNIRVTPFWWEPLDKYIDRFGLEDVYIYGSDYPHYEGGKNPLKVYSDALDRLGPTVAEKFFVTNGQLLMS